MSNPPARSAQRHEPAALRSPEALPAAVLWDMDGTLIDTEEYWIAAERDLVGRFGGTWTEQDGLALVGKDLQESARIIKERAGVAMAPAAIVDFLLDNVIDHVVRDLPWRPGALDLHSALYEAGIPMALVTMSYERFARPVADALPASRFDVVVAGDQVRRGKPDPEAYLTAARALGVDIARCVALEDSPAGVSSALAAGAPTVHVMNLVDVPSAPGLTKVDSLTELTPADLARIAAA